MDTDGVQSAVKLIDESRLAQLPFPLRVICGIGAWHPRMGARRIGHVKLWRGSADGKAICVRGVELYMPGGVQRGAMPKNEHRLICSSTHTLETDRLTYRMHVLTISSHDLSSEPHLGCHHTPIPYDQR